MGPIITGSLLFDTQAFMRNHFEKSLLFNCVTKRFKKFNGFGSTILSLFAPSAVAMKAVGPTQAPMSK